MFNFSIESNYRIQRLSKVNFNLFLWGGLCRGSKKYQYP